jgi:beta-glucosidase
MRPVRFAVAVLTVSWAGLVTGVAPAVAAPPVSATAVGATAVGATAVGATAVGATVVGATTVSSATASPDQPASCSSVGTGNFQPEPMAQAEQQARALASKMTLSQDLTLMHGVSPGATPDGTVGATPAIPSLGIPAVNQQDGPAGVGDGVSGVTQLPAPVDLAAAWDPNLADCYGKVIGTEERNKGVEEVYGPTINIVRVPQWGRAFEALGEDPYLDGTVAAAEVNGIQSQGEMAQLKHFAVYNQETNRNTSADNSIVSTRAIQEIYTPAWTTVIDKANPSSVMCSYSTVNGQFACQNPYLLNTVLTSQLGYQGFVGSDYGATHSTVASANAGLAQEQPESTYFGAALQQAVQNGQVSQETINAAVIKILTQMYRFRLFTDYPTGNIGATVTNAADQQAGLGVAEAGTTLLKNTNAVLPYATTTTSVAVIGADASTAPMTDGGGSAGVVPSATVTPLQGIKNTVSSGTTVTYDDGSNVTTAAIDAKNAKEAVVFVNDQETEGADRSSLQLPGNQDQLIAAVAAANPRTVVVLNTGAPVLMPWLSQVAGVVEAWYPGQDDGTAIANVLFGHVNPSGHLPVTFPASATETPVSTPQQFPGVNGQVNYSEGIDVGYRWYTQNNVTPLFPFGYGLSYTTFSYSGLRVIPAQTEATGSGGPLAVVTATVTNTGKVAGADVAQLYLTDPASSGEPPRQLAGYQRVSLQPGQSTRVTFTLDARSLSYWNDAANGYVVPDGAFTAYLGDSSASADLPLQGSFSVTRSAGPQEISVHAPATLKTGGSNTVSTVGVTFTNHSDVADFGVRLGLSVSTGGAPIPAADAARLLGISGGQTVATVAPGGTVTANFQVNAPPNAAPGSYQFTGTASYAVSGSGRITTTNTATTKIPFASPQAAFDSVGIAPSTDIAQGNFDGGGFSFQAEQLSADGFASGDTVAADGQTLTLPAVKAGAPDEITAQGQVINLNQKGSQLAFLGAGTFGTQGGPVTITYTDGSTQTNTLNLADWYADSPATGTFIAASSPWNVPPQDTQFFGLHTVAVYYAQIPVDASKTIASVTIPDNPLLHLFDIGVPSAATYASVTSAYDDEGLAPAATPLDGNYDGGGYSFNSDALPAAGLAAGAKVTAQGVSFTWPAYAPGKADNIRAEGQTVAMQGTGTVLGFLGSGGFGTQSGTVTITYTDGSTQTATLSFADWYADSAVSGGTVVATVPWNDAPGSTLGAHQVSVYSATVPLQSGKTVASVTLPANFNMHIFAMAAG